MLDFKEITIEDKALFDKYLKPFNSQASELTFTNFFMWRFFYRFKFTEINGLLCIISEPKEGSPYSIIPIGEILGDNFKNTVFELNNYFKALNWELQFKKVTEDQLQSFKNIVSDDKIVQ